MKKETLTRFDNENIVLIAIDEGQASGKIINEVAGTETPIGGGGSSVPLLHMTVKNNSNNNYQLGLENSGFSNRLIDHYYIDFPVFTISPGIEAEHDFLYFKFGENTFAGFMTALNANITYTDENNCTVISNEDAQMVAIIITDTSADASVTVTIS